MKKLSQEAKFNLKNGFGSLISNNCAIEAGKSMPWWSALIIALVATFLPIIPIMVGVLNTNGNTVITSTNYGLDRNVTVSMISYNENKYSVRIDETSKEASLYQNDALVNPQTPLELYSYVNPITHQYDVRTYYLWDFNEKTISDYYSAINNTSYIVGTTTAAGDDDPEGSTYYKPNIIVYYKGGFTLSIYKSDTATSVRGYTGDYQEMTFASSNTNRDLFLEIAKVEGMEIPATVAECTPEYEAGVKSNFAKVLDESYLTTKNRTLLYTTTIYYAIYFALVLFLGLLMFLLTRGKRNFNNYLRWYQCMSISGWSSFAPGVLALILGFMMNQYAMMFFILFFGVRIMWMTMKNLSPTYQG